MMRTRLQVDEEHGIVRNGSITKSAQALHFRMWSS